MGEHESYWVKSHLYERLSLNNGDRRRIRWRHRVRRSRLFDPCNDIAQAFEVCVYLPGATQLGGFWVSPKRDHTWYLSRVKSSLPIISA